MFKQTGELLTEHGLKAVSQLKPVKPFWHVHLYWWLDKVQIPLFWQGFLVQTLSWHNPPEKPFLHSQIAVVDPVKTQVPSFRHGFGLQTKSF